MRTSLFLCIVVALTGAVMPISAQDIVVPDSAYFLEPYYQLDGCNQSVRRTIPVYLFTDQESYWIYFEFSWQGEDQLDTILFYPPFPEIQFMTNFEVDTTARWCFVELYRTINPYFPPHSGVLANLVFHSDIGHQLSVVFDPLQFTLNAGSGPWTPSYLNLDSTFVTPELGPVPPGDADASTEVDIDDVVYLLNYIFAGGCSPWDQNSGDVDASCGIDIDDVVYLIEFIFGSGQAPLPGCVR